MLEQMRVFPDLTKMRIIFFFRKVCSVLSFFTLLYRVRLLWIFHIFTSFASVARVISSGQARRGEIPSMRLQSKLFSPSAFFCYWLRWWLATMFMSSVPPKKILHRANVFCMQ